jgi:hypothetical protein
MEYSGIDTGIVKYQRDPFRNHFRYYYRAHTRDTRSHIMHDFPKSIYGILFITT